MHACNPSTLGGRGRQISEFEANLVYRVSSRTARATQRNPVSKKTKSKKKKKERASPTDGWLVARKKQQRCLNVPRCLSRSLVWSSGQGR